MERPELAEELKRLAAADLTVRQRLLEAGELHRGYHPEMRAIHHQNGKRFEAILDEVNRWPGYRMVGTEGSEAAFLLVQHDIGNPKLIRRSRQLYAEAVKKADADPTYLAKLEDRIRYFEGRLQRYGTHVGWNEAGEFGPWPPIENPNRVDEFRDALGLEPLADAITAAQAGKPASRPAADVLDEHQQARDFARQAGWLNN